jgi:hypothetical protein
MSSLSSQEHAQQVVSEFRRQLQDDGDRGGSEAHEEEALSSAEHLQQDASLPSENFDKNNRQGLDLDVVAEALCRHPNFEGD